MRRFAVFLLVATLLQNGLVRSNEKAIPKGAERYYNALQKRPESESLFLRFSSAWVEEKEPDSLESFLASDPGNTVNRFLLARFYQTRNYDILANIEWNWLAENTETAGTLRGIAFLNLSQNSFRENDFEKALDFIRDGLRLEIGDPELNLELARHEGRILIRSSRREEGLEVLNNLMNSNPDDSLLKEDVVTLLSELGMRREAIDVQKALVEKLSDDPLARTLAEIDLGRLFSKSRLYDDAIEIWTTALDTSGSDTWLERETLGLICSSLRRRDELIKLRDLLEALNRSNPGRTAISVERAKALTDLREERAALEAWRDLLAKNRGNRKLREEFVRALSKLDRKNEAVRQMEQIVAQNPDDHTLLIDLSELHKEADDTKSAVATLKTYLAKSRVYESDFLQVARKFSRWKEIPEADSLYEKMLTEFSESEAVIEAFAIHLYDTDRKLRAVQLFMEIGSQGELHSLRRVAFLLQNRFETEAAFSLIEGRFEEFEKDPEYLPTLIRAALLVDRDEDAFEWALENLSNLEDSGTLDQNIEAIQQAVRAGKAFDITGEKPLARLSQDRRTSESHRALRATLLSQSGRELEAVRELESIDKPGLIILFTLSSFYQQQNDWQQAAVALEKALDHTLQHDRVERYEEIASLYERAEDPTTALDWVRKWKLALPGDSKPWLREVSLLEKRGEMRSALKTLRKASGIFPDETRIKERLSSLYAASGYQHEAIETLWELYDSTEDFWIRRRWIGSMIELSEERSLRNDLMAAFAERAKANPQSIGAALAHTEILERFGNRELHREELLRASRIEPENTTVLHKVASLYEAEGKYDQALAQLELAAKSDPSSRSIQKIARIHVLRGDLDSAILRLDNLPSGVQSTAEEAIHFGERLMQIGEWDKAEIFLRKKMELHPDNHAITFYHAITLRELHRYPDAIRAFAKFLRPGEFRFPAPVSSPPPASRIDKWLRAYNTATSYREVGPGDTVFQIASRGGYHSSYNSSQSSPIFLPSDATLAEGAATRHLAEILSLRPKISLQSELESLKVPPRDAELAVLFLKRAPGGISSPEEIRFIEKFCEDIEVAEHFFRAASFNEQNSDLIDKLLETIHDERGAATALEFAIRGQRIDTVLDLAEQSATVTDSLVSEMAKMLQRRQVDITREQEEQFDAFFDKWTPHNVGNANTLTRGIAFANLLQRKRSSPADWTKFYLSTWNQVADLTAPASPAPGLRTLAPVMLPGIPDWFVNSIHPNTIPEEELHSFFPFEEHPLAATLILSRQEASGIEQQLISLLESGEKANLLPEASALLRSLLLAKQGNKLEAITLAEGVRPQLNREFERNKVDAFIFQLASDSEANSPLRSHALEAAKRMRLSRELSLVTDWESVSQTLQQWGEVNLLRRPAYIAAANRNAVLFAQNARTAQHNFSFHGYPIRGHFPSSVAPPSQVQLQLPDANTLRQQITPLVDEKNVDAIVGIVSSQLPLLATNLISQRVGYGDLSSPYRNILSSLEELNLTEETLKRSRPGENARFLDTLRYAVILEMHGRHSDAVETYDQLLETEPAHPLLLGRRITSLARIDINRAVEDLIASDDNLDRNELLQNIIRESGKDLTETLALAELLLPVLPDLIESSPQGDPSLQTFGFHTSHSYPSYPWVDALLGKFEQESRVGKEEIPHLFLKEESYELSSFSPELQSQLVELLEKRRDLYLEICLKAFEINHRPNIFSRLNFLCESGEIERSQLAELAIRSLTNEVEQRQLTWVSPQTPTRVRSGRNWDWEEKRHSHLGSITPEAWLIENQDIKMAGDWIAEHVLSLESNPSDTLPLPLIAELYSCSPDQFQEKFQHAIINSRVNGHEFSLLQRIRFVRPEVEKHLSLETFIFENISLSESNSNFWRLAAEALSTSTIAEGPESLAKFLTKLETKIFGNKDSMKKLITEYELGIKSNKRAIRSEEFQQLRQYGMFLEQLYNDPNLFFDAWHYAENTGYSRIRDSNHLRIFYNTINNRNNPEDLPILLTKLANAPLTSFPFIPKHIENRGSGTLSEIGDFIVKLKSHLRGREEERTELLRKVVLAEQTAFGGQLIAAILSPNSNDKIVDLFDRNIGEIHKLPEEQRGLFSELAFSLVEPRRLTEPLTDDERATFRSLSLEKTFLLRKRLTRLKNAESLEDLKLENPDNFVNEVSSHLIEMMAWDWQAAFEVYPNLVRIGNEAVASGKLRKERSTPGERILDRIVYESPAGPMVAFVCSALSLDESYALFPSQLYGETLKKRFEEAKREGENEITRLSRFLEGVRAELPDDTPQSTLAALFYPLTSPSRSNSNVIANWSLEAEHRLLFPQLAIPISRLADWSRESEQAEYHGRQLQEAYVGEGTLSERAFAAQSFFNYYNNVRQMARGTSYLLTSLLESEASINSEVVNRFLYSLKSHYDETNPYWEHKPHPADSSPRNANSTQYPGKLRIPIEELFSLADAFSEIHCHPDEEKKLFRTHEFSERSIRFLFEIQSRQNDPAKVATLFRTFESKLSEDLTNEFLWLVRGGKYELAEHFARNHGDLILAGRLQRSQTFDARFEKSAYTFLSQLPSEDLELRALAEFCVIRIPDPRRVGKGPVDYLPRNHLEARYLDFAEKHPLDLITAGETKDQIIVELSKYPSTRNLISEQLALQTGEITISGIAKLERDERDLQLELLAAAFSKDNDDGDQEAWFESLDEIASIKDAKLKREFTHWSVRLFEKTFKDSLVAGEAGEIAFPLWRKTLANMEVPESTSRFSYHGDDPGPEFARLLDAIIFHENEKSDLTEMLLSLTPSERAAAIGLRELSEMGHPRHSGRLRLPYSKKIAERQYTKSEEMSDGAINIIFSLDRASESGLSASKLRDLMTRKLSSISSAWLKKKFYRHCCLLFEKEYSSDEGYSVYYWGGWSFASHLFEKSTLQEAYTSGGSIRHALAFQSDILWNHPPVDLTLNISSSYGHQERFKNQRESLYGSLDAVQHLAKIFQRMNEYDTYRSEMGNQIVNQLFFFEVCQAMDNAKEVAKCAEFALEEHRRSGDAYALEFAVASRFWIAAHSHDFLWDVSVSEPDLWDLHVLRALRDESLALSVRNGIAWHFLRNGSDHCSEALVMKASEVCADTANSDYKVPQKTFSCLLRHFHNLPDSEWKTETSRRLIDGWNHQLRFEGESVKKSRTYRPGTNTVLAALELHLTAGSAQQLDDFTKRFHTQIQETPTALSLFVKHRQNGYANKWLKSGIRTGPINFHLDEFSWTRPFDAELERATSVFIESLEDKESKARAAAYLAVIPDAISHSVGEAIPGKRRHERLADLAVEYQSEFALFADAEKKEFLNLISHEATALLKKPRVELFEIFRKDVAEFQTRLPNKKDSHQVNPLLPAIAVAEAMDGNLDLVLQVAGPTFINENRYLTEYQRKAVEECIITAIQQHFDTALANGDKKILGSVAETSHAVASNIKGSTEQKIKLYLLSLLAETASGTNSESKRLELAKESYFHPDRDAYHISHNLARVLNLHIPGNRERYRNLRFQLLTAIFTDPLIQTGFEGDHKETPMLLHFLEHHLISAEEIVQHSETLNSLWPGNTLLTLEIAKSCFLHGKSDLAADLAAKICRTPFNKSLKKYSAERNRFFKRKEEAIRILDKSGRTETALHELEVFLDGSDENSKSRSVRILEATIRKSLESEAE